MVLTVIWVTMIVISVLFGAATGNAEAVGTAAIEGAAAAVELCIGIAGVTCLWSGVMEVLSRSGISASLSRTLRPILSRLFPSAAGDVKLMESLSANVSANMLGLGNAATPMGIRAAAGMIKGKSDTATDELCRLVVLNTASIQLIPATVAGIRAAAGAASPFDILPSVWVTSLAAVSVGLICCRVFSRISGQ